jgi:hypothetical protein
MSYTMRVWLYEAFIVYETVINRYLAHSSLGDYIDEIQHQQEENVLIRPSEENRLISKEEKELISGTREKSAVGDSAEPKQ